MASRIPAKKSARSVAEWRARKGPSVAKLLTRRVLSVERQIDQDDQRIFELTTDLAEVRRRMEKRTRAAAIALSDLAQRLKGAEQSLRDQANWINEMRRVQYDHEQTIGSLIVVVLNLHDRIVSSLQSYEAEARAKSHAGRLKDRLESATKSSKGSRNRTNDSQSET